MKIKILVLMGLMGWSLGAVAEADISDSRNSLGSMAGSSRASKCANVLVDPNMNTNYTSGTIQECKVLQTISGGEVSAFSNSEKNDSKRYSADGQIVCQKVASYTSDYDACEKALNAYNAVTVAETAMNVQQQIRTDLKNQNIQKNAAKKAQQGDYQTGALDAGIESHKHMKAMNTEKMLAYGTAISALTYAYRFLPSEKEVVAKCKSEAGDAAVACESAIRTNKSQILANHNAKVALAGAIAQFSAKAIAAGVAMKQHNFAADKIAEAKAPYENGGEDVMMERCVFNPTDPACAKDMSARPGEMIAPGDFSFGGAGSSNTFDMTPESGSGFEEGAPTDLGNGQEVAAMNSPFVDEAKAAQGILDPAAAAQMQPGGGGGKGGGGVGGGMGGGSASLGNDLSGEDKSAAKEANIKTSKVSGIYGAAAGGGGFKGVGKGKSDTNPFASLFDAKSQGGVEEDRSIASSDINGKASGLFQRISKRYVQVQSEKRVEANNLE